MKRFQKEKDKTSLRKYSSVARCLYLLVCILIVLQVIVSNRLATYGEKIEKIKKETEELNQGNKSLEEKIAEASSLSILTKLAKEKGFIKPSQIVVIPPQMPVAQNARY